DQVGQFQVLEHEFEKLFLGDLEDKFVHAFAGITGLARTFSATSTRWARDMLTAAELFVSGVNHRLLAAAPMVKHRLVDIATGNTDLFAMLHVGDGATADGFFNC